MSSFQLHHYLPRFYVKHFVDDKLQFWVGNQDKKNLDMAAKEH
ncbi:hypothetical protein [Vibrio sp. CAU 1672]|nr:hypothetical protein [Vibrio sp. CAU 1672]